MTIFGTSFFASVVISPAGSGTYSAALTDAPIDQPITNIGSINEIEVIHIIGHIDGTKSLVVFFNVGPTDCVGLDANGNDPLRASSIPESDMYSTLAFPPGMSMT